MSADSWIDVPGGSDFPLENLPFGVFRRHAGDRARSGVAIGDRIVDLIALHEAGVMRLRRQEVDATSLNPMLDRLGPIRTRVGELLAAGNDELLPHTASVLVDQADVEMLLPIEVGDYVDFYSSEQHATNVGRLFRPDGDPLLPNWKHIPIGYHGRSSTVVVSGTEIRRPLGQRKPRDASVPTFGPSQRLDIELEVGFVTSRGNGLGVPIPVADAEDHIAGLLLVNDWSARDIQAWEYQPLGPFLGKSFATTVSPWLVTMPALEPYRVEAPAQDPEPLSYLVGPGRRAVEMDLEVVLNGTVVARTNLASMYWTMDQQLAHAASNGAVVRPGDLFASGTVSGSEPGSFGSLLELTRGGAEPLTLEDGSIRTFLEDGDTVELRASCGGDGRPRIGFGPCLGTVVAAPTTPDAVDTPV